MSELSFESRLTPSPDVVSQELEGELVLLSLDRAEYYGLNPTGTQVWKWMAQGASIGTMADRLAAEGRVDGDRARRDVMALARSLVDERLALPTDAAAS
jgi:hypothetical protein